MNSKSFPQRKDLRPDLGLNEPDEQFSCSAPSMERLCEEGPTQVRNCKRRHVLNVAKYLSASEDQLHLQVLEEGKSYPGVCLNVLNGSLESSGLEIFFWS